MGKHHGTKKDHDEIPRILVKIAVSQQSSINHHAFYHMFYQIWSRNVKIRELYISTSSPLYKIHYQIVWSRKEQMKLEIELVICTTVSSFTLKLQLPGPSRMWRGKSCQPQITCMYPRFTYHVDFLIHQCVHEVLFLYWQYQPYECRRDKEGICI